ncbi:hypothetical protein [Burkholderia sp. PAMC 26561]|uniref:hypothetical protein n=1 Tax=Burkholderia sp. PAMC 26561 TaxID=1795043 RepID=UPI00076B131D|nr:hypothetical protein [Burkholderia sp. PAMC 26561]AME28634.1 hypothetical protein AXG89_33125 [Burkholderia sp. PAMC 26561]
MDLRDIQRLHAQFAPDMTTIDLPRQIAALPAPANAGGNEVAPTMRRRWAQTGPITRLSVLAAAAAVVVAMAGMGAASIYKGLSTAQRSMPVTATAPANTQTAQSTNNSRADANQVREIDAAPAQPVMNAPGLTSSDLAGASMLGLTAEQFRKSLKASSTPTQAAPSAPAQFTAESERAALSPIHRSTPRSSIAPAVAPNSIPSATINALAVSPAPAAAIKPVEPVVVQQVPQQSVSVAPVTASEATPVVSTASAATATKQTHQSRRRISKPRVEQESVAEPTTSTRAVTPSAPAARTGSNEVQMF